MGVASIEDRQAERSVDRHDEANTRVSRLTPKSLKFLTLTDNFFPHSMENNIIILGLPGSIKHCCPILNKSGVSRQIFVKVSAVSNFTEIRPGAAALIHVDRRTDTAKLAVAFRVRRKRLKRGNLAALKVRWEPSCQRNNNETPTWTFTKRHLHPCLEV